MNTASFKTGFFVFSGVAVFAVIAVLLAKFDPFAKSTHYVIQFSVRDGVYGISKGSEVRIGGLARGAVTMVTPVFNDTGHITSIDVGVDIDEDVQIYTNATVLRMMPLLGSTAWLNFISLGDGGVRLEPGSTIQAMPSNGLLASIVGPMNATKADKIIDDFVEFSDFLAKVPDEYKTRIVPVLENASTIVADLRTDYSDWRVKVGSTLTSAQSTMSKLDISMTDVQGMLERNGPKIDSTIANIDSAVMIGKDALTHVNQETLPLVDSALRKAESSVDSFGKSIEIVHDMLLTSSPDITEMLANLRTSAGQLKLATLEIRRSPWKILYQPNADQVAHENLYDSARSFAMAAGDLRAAGESLRLVIERDPGRYEADEKFRNAVQAMVLQALEKYELAQQQLNSVLLGPAPAGESPAGESPAPGASVDPSKAK